MATSPSLRSPRPQQLQVIPASADSEAAAVVDRAAGIWTAAEAESLRALRGDAAAGTVRRVLTEASPEQRLRVCAALGPMWWMNGMAAEGLESMQLALSEAADAPPPPDWSSLLPRDERASLGVDVGALVPSAWESRWEQTAKGARRGELEAPSKPLQHAGGRKQEEGWVRGSLGEGLTYSAVQAILEAGQSVDEQQQTLPRQNDGATCGLSWLSQLASAHPRYSIRPASLQEPCISRVFVEPSCFRRRKFYTGRKLDHLNIWEQSGGKKGATVLRDPMGVSERRFRRQYGKVRVQAVQGAQGRALCRFHMYVEVSGTDDKEVGPRIYFVFESAARAGAGAAGAAAHTATHTGRMPHLHAPVQELGQPLMIRHRKEPWAKADDSDDVVLLSLDRARGSGPNFVTFKAGSATCGAIKDSSNAGVALVSSAGDFAEWHALTDEQKCSPVKLTEGSVVGFRDGKIGSATEGEFGDSLALFQGSGLIHPRL